MGLNKLTRQGKLTSVHYRFDCSEHLTNAAIVMLAMYCVLRILV